MTNPPPRTSAPLVSIVTVCFDAARQLPATLRSYREQGPGPWEWVVVDGASRDGSAEWLAAQRPDVFVSEPDRGIYDAMNKALRLARGEWVFFLNAGDAFADATTLVDLLPLLRASDGVDLLYGDVLYVGERGERRRRFHWVSRGRLLFGDLCHQAVFARRSLFQRFGPFDDRLRYNADFDWFVRVFRGGAGLRYVPRLIARFDDAGAHVQAGGRHRAERDLVRTRYAPRPLWALGRLLLRAELRLRKLAGQEI